MIEPRTLDRREFLRISVSAAGGLVVGLSMPGCSVEQESSTAADLGFLLRIEPDGQVVFRAPGPEIGQHLTTTQAMLVAEELEVDVDTVKVERAPLMLKRDDTGNATYASVPQFSGGSMAVKRTWQPLLLVGAEARTRLILAAAARLGVPFAECHAKDARVIHVTSQRSLGYGEVAKDAASVDLGDIDVVPKPRQDHRIVGRARRSLEINEIVTGRAAYGIDVEIPGLKHAVIERAPNFGARVKSYDDREALAVDGVIGTVSIDGAEPSHYQETILGDGVAVVAGNLWSAVRARKLLKIHWEDGPFLRENDSLFDAQAQRKMTAARPVELRDAGDYERVIESGAIARQFGNVTEAFKEAALTFSQTYDIPFAAHATMEPQNCTAHVHDGGCDLYVGTQLPASIARTVSEYLGIDIMKINVFTKRSGGGFGRRLRRDYALEAVMISKAIGAPVKVTWSREDDIRYDYYRPKARFEMNAAFDKDKRLIAWHVREASTPLEKHAQELAMGKSWVDIEVSGFYADHGVFAAEELYFDNFPAHESFVPNCRMDHFYIHSGAPRHAWRAPGTLVLEFANQSFIDELAHELNEDPVDFRLRLIGEPKAYDFAFDWVPAHENGRLAAVLALAAEKAEWGKHRNRRGVGQGVAVAYNWGTYVAHVVDVRVLDRGSLAVLKVTSAVDCGPVINPDGIRKQVEGAVNDALSAALHQEINIRNGFAVQSNFHDYRMMRMDESPRVVEVHIIEGGAEDDLRGMGEPPVPPLAPALCNAIFAATGKRIRRLPIGDQLRFVNQA